MTIHDIAQRAVEHTHDCDKPADALARAIADMDERARALLDRFREQDKARGFSFGPCDYLWTAKIPGPGESSPAESKARFDSTRETKLARGYARAGAAVFAAFGWLNEREDGA